MVRDQPPPRHLTLILVSTVAALVARSVIQIHLQRAGFSDQLAADLSYLSVPVVLVALCLPIRRDVVRYVRRLYCSHHLSLRILLSGLAIGILMRIAWWGLTFARLSFGWFTESGVAVGPTFVWHCPAPVVIVLGIFVTAILVPLIEEIVHRGYIYRASLRFGVPAALLLSSALFALFHKAFSWPVVFIIGLVLAFLFHRTGSLWTSTIAHATYNLMIQFDWHCLSGRWQVADEDLPVLSIGLVSISICLAAVAGLVLIIRRIPETPKRPGH